MDTVDGKRINVESPVAGQRASTMTRKILAEGPRLILRKPEDQPAGGLTPFGDKSRLSASLIFVPISTVDGVIGALSIQSYTYNAYTATDLDELQALADYCSGALERTLAEARLLESEERHRQMFVSNRSIQLLIDSKSGRLVDANPAACEFYGIPKDRTTQYQIDDFTLPLPGKTALGMLAEAVESGKLLILNQRLSSGELRHLEAYATLIFIQHRPFFHVIFHDVTQRIRAQQRSSAFSELGRKLSQARQPTEAAEIIVECADELLGWDACFLDLLLSDAEQKLFDNSQLIPLIHYDVVDDRRVRVPSISKHLMPGTLSYKSVTDGPQLLLRKPNDESDEAFRFGDESRPSKSLMFVPIRTASALLGILSIQSYRNNAYTAGDLDTLVYLADHCSGALERTRAEEQARVFTLAVEHANDMVVIAACPDDSPEKSRVVFANQAFEAATGFGRNEVLGQPIVNLWSRHSDSKSLDSLYNALKLNQPITVEIEKQRKDGTRYFAEISAFAISGIESRLRYYVLIYRDVTERKVAEQQLTYQAFHDPLTDLPNRVLFTERFNRMLARAKRQGDKFAVLFLDLDGFKLINDTYGHQVGDQLLVAISRRLETCIRPIDTVARLGGDEFVVLLEDLASPSDASIIAERMLEAFKPSFVIGNHSVKCSASIGLVMHTPEMESISQVLRFADEALYRAKADGKDQYSSISC
jgi:diguanylate cyclase (GGDEF)-like protein/PAS domain S-box-containing protein